MNWLKKQMNKFLNKDDNDYEYEEFYEDYEEEQSQQLDSYKETPKAKQKTFRFPLIEDEEFSASPSPSSKAAFNQMDDTYSGQIEDLSLPKHLNNHIVDSSVYDVEVSGIRDLLANRTKRTGRTTITRSRPEQENRSKASLVFRDAQNDLPTSPKVTNYQVEKADESALIENRKRFVPSDVPSPVYGFSRPSPIEQLLEKRKEEHDKKELAIPTASKALKETTTNEAIENILEEKEPISVVRKDESEQLDINEKIEVPAKQPITFEDKLTDETNHHHKTTTELPVPQTTSFAVEFENQMKEAVQQELNIEQLSSDQSEIHVKEVVVEQVQIENSTIHIGEVTVVQPPMKEDEKQDVLQEQSIEELPLEEQSVEKKEKSGIPFNVLMLKTDKEKWRIQQQFKNMKSTSTIVDKNQAKQEPSSELNHSEVEQHIVTSEKAQNPQSIGLEISELEMYNNKATQLTKEPEVSIENTTPSENAQNPQSIDLGISEVAMDNKTATQLTKEHEVSIENIIPSEKAQNPQSIGLEISELEMDNNTATQLTKEPKVSIENTTPSEKAQNPQSIDLGISEVEMDNKTATQSTEENEVSIENTVPFNAATESVSVITMAPVTSMSNVSTLEKTVIDVESFDEISATTEMEVATATEQKVTTENLDIPEEHSIDNEKYFEQPSILAETFVEDQVQETPRKPVHVYQKPDDEFLEPPEEKTQDTEWMEQQGDTLVEALSYFQVSAQIESIMQGPAVTQFEITVSHGTKVSKIRNLSDDLKLALAAKDIRIQAPIPGKSSIGIEIPNRVSRAVRLSEVTNSASFLESDSPLEAALGLDLTGKPVTIDLRKMPHGLIAGATGSGKSVCINSILVSLLYKAAPHELKLMLIDPKMVELAPFNHIPHLVSPVITDVKAATAALKWAVEEMERRYQLFAHAGARDITRYNAIADKNNEHSLKLPYILIVIDELADLMMMSPADVEEAICRIAQKARACGIHLIVATQRPSVDVITGLIKSNIPTRIAFAVSSQIDSRTILDAQGAERLLGRGDMLYLGNGMSAPVRLQGTFVTDDEIEAIIEHVREQGEPDYIFDQEELLKKTEVSAEQDELFEDVCRFVYEQGGASTSLIQRKYHIGYNRAARLIDMLESHGFVSEARGSKPRESYITEEDLIAMFE
ncbi:DNA translocase FtsK [Lysinibacillus sp. CNPSo 3705]|uniref:DNA translocase FtsK n=1 Tax=Lysinibacillus sp. CNPSo 3705 TaxID=3028148 RepID=UPI00236392D1|nr:DNA translocase FtsK [Lysinibacillus sp. CNPSo 3705]MDD1503924.1 DNA translocase FtsK [Lysinibacillus sp. CNPSo 3705]